MDTNEPREHDGSSDTGGQNDQPTTPLPWWQEPHDERDHPTTPLPWPEGQPPVSPPAAPAPGMAVTDGMKIGEPQARPSFLRRHAFGLGVAAAVLAVVVVAGGTAWGVSAAVAANNTASPAAMGSATHAKKGAASGTRTHAKGAVGTLTAMSGGTWTVKSAAGTTFTVTVGSATTYGTAKKPATASSFAVGDRIGVLGTRGGDTVTATRIVHLAAKHGATTGTPTPGATT